MFQPIPAVDIRGGRCVRLRQGDYAQETVYDADPVEVARRWQQQGAERLHVVDLDGARDGVRQNAAVIARLLDTVTIPVQVGGGVRSLEGARELLDAGADRVVFGTVAAEQPERLADWVAALGAERVLVGVDAKDGKVATRGWLNVTDLQAVDLCRQLAEAGVRRVFYTDINRDGMLEGPNVPAIRTLIEATGLSVIASGGVSSAQHLRDLAAAGAEGAIIGKALYDGRLTLAEALEAAVAAC